MIDYIEDAKKAQEFVVDRLKDVKKLLDEIAEETGIVYVAMPEEQIAFIAKVGAQWSSWLIGAHKVISDRLDLSSKHSDWMFTRHPEGTAENHPEKPVQKDLSDNSPNSEERM